MATGGFNEVARSAFLPWFEPNKKYKLKAARQRGNIEMFIDGEPVLQTDAPESMQVPVLHILGSFVNPGTILYVDNVVVRAPERMQDEIAATGMEWRSFGKSCKRRAVGGFIGNVTDSPDSSLMARHMSPPPPIG